MRVRVRLGADLGRLADAPLVSVDLGKARGLLGYGRELYG